MTEVVDVNAVSTGTDDVAPGTSSAQDTTAQNGNTPDVGAGSGSDEGTPNQVKRIRELSSQKGQSDERATKAENENVQLRQYIQSQAIAAQNQNKQTTESNNTPASNGQDIVLGEADMPLVEQLGGDQTAIKLVTDVKRIVLNEMKSGGQQVNQEALLAAVDQRVGQALTSHTNTIAAAATVPNIVSEYANNLGFSEDDVQVIQGEVQRAIQAEPGWNSPKHIETLVDSIAMKKLRKGDIVPVKRTAKPTPGPTGRGGAPPEAPDEAVQQDAAAADRFPSLKARTPQQRQATRSKFERSGA